MTYLTNNPTPNVLVNYTNAATSAPNEVYLSTTETPDSLAFLIKNNVLISYSIIAEPEAKEEPLSEREQAPVVTAHF
ncbi:hypothetical protein HRH25_12745 [Flavisolibacter sp. BT320]|nr:hypothetical protein [Flavisolibacter longurius]